MNEALTVVAPCIAPASIVPSWQIHEGKHAFSEVAPLPGCVGFDRKAFEAVALRVLQSASASSTKASADTPAPLRFMAALAQQGILQRATPPSVKPGPNGIAVRANERFISVLGKINGVQSTLLTAVAERDNANAPWRMTYTIGSGAVQMRLQQQPIAGQPGQFKTTIGPLDPDFDMSGFGPPVQLGNTGPLVVQAAKDGRSATATIDGHAVFPASRSDLAH
jgi:hypothetical protein